MGRRKIDVLNVLKYGMAAVIVIYVIVLLARMGGDAPMETVKANVEKTLKTGGMAPAGAQDLKRHYKLNANDYEEVLLYLPNDVMSVDELLIVRLKDDSQAEAVMEAAQKRLDTQKESFEGYGVEQTSLINSAVLAGRGSYVFLSVGEDTEEAYRAFRKSL